MDKYCNYENQYGWNYDSYYDVNAYEEYKMMKPDMYQHKEYEEVQMPKSHHYDYDYYCKVRPKYKEEYCIKVPEVIGRNKKEELVEVEIPFPKGSEAIEIVEVKHDVVLDIVEVVKDKVLINGRLHKNILYKTKKNSMYNKRCCQDIQYVNGDVKHVSTWVPFSMYIDIPGAKPGDMHEIEYAGARCDQSVDVLMDPLPNCYDGITRYCKLREKTIVTVDLKVLRHTQITVDTENNICP